ncbi:MAG TPA: YbhN family protein [Trebonia sp.]
MTDGEPTRQSRSRERWRLWRPWLSMLAKPARRLALIFILLLVIEYLVVPELVGASKNLYLLGRVSAWWVVAGAVLEGVSLYCYAILTKVLLPPGPKPGLWTLFRIDLSAAAVAHVIPAGTLGTAALGFKLFTSEGISGNDATVMMAAKGIGSTVVLNVLLWLSLVISIPLAGFNPIYATVAIIGAIVLLGVAVLVVGITRGAGFASRVLRMLGDKIPFLSGEAVERAVLDAAHSFSLLARDRRVMAWSLVWASLNWLLDAASLWCFVAAFGHLTNPIELFAAYGIANVAGALPITPGGLGVVDSIAPALLLGFGVPGGIATLGVLGWRVVNFWLPILTGALAFVSLKVKPVSGRTTWRSAFAGLFAAGQPEEAGVTGVTEVSGVSGGSGDPAEGAARERVPAQVVPSDDAPDGETRAGEVPGEDPEVEGEGDQARTTR